MSRHAYSDLFSSPDLGGSDHSSTPVACLCGAPEVFLVVRSIGDPTSPPTSSNGSAKLTDYMAAELSHDMRIPLSSIVRRSRAARGGAR